MNEIPYCRTSLEINQKVIELQEKFDELIENQKLWFVMTSFQCLSYKTKYIMLDIFKILHDARLMHKKILKQINERKIF